MFEHTSQFPLDSHRGGRVRDTSYNYGHSQNSNLVVFNGRGLLYDKGYQGLPAASNVPRVGLSYINLDGFQEETGTVRVPFNGRNEIPSGGNPLYELDDAVTFPSGASAPMDLYTNGSLTSGGRFGDLTAVVFGAKVFHYCHIYNYNNVASNRTALMESTDGTSFSFVQEITFGGGNFGATMGPTWVHDGVMYSLVGSEVSGRGFEKRLRYSPDGLNWSQAADDQGISLSDNPEDLDYYGLPVGRALVHGDYVYAFIPCSNGSSDWPEAVKVWRYELSALPTFSGSWEEYHSPVLFRDPTKGGCWQLQPFKVTEDWWGIYNAWGWVGFENINDPDLNTMRETPYYQSDVNGFKHTCAVQATNTLIFDNWDYELLTDGNTYKIKVGGRYFCTGSTASDGDQVQLSNDLTNTDLNFNWVVEKEAGLWLLKPQANPNLAIGPDGGSDARARSMNLVVSSIDASPVNNFELQWVLCPKGSSVTPKTASVQNRFSSLYMQRGATQETGLEAVSPSVTFIEVV